MIALAVLAASGASFAQSTVNIYGLLDANIISRKSGGVTNTRINSGSINTSRFGLKGSEDLGGGLRANFKLESAVSMDTGSSGVQLFGRESYVGLSGGFGEVKLGKMWTPYDDLQGLGAAAFNANIFAPANNVWVSNAYF